MPTGGTVRRFVRVHIGLCDWSVACASVWRLVRLFDHCVSAYWIGQLDFALCERMTTGGTVCRLVRVKISLCD